MYIIEYQKRGFPHMHSLIVLNSADEYLEAFHIDEVICTKRSIIEMDLSVELIKIVTSVIFDGPFRKINPNSPCMSNA